MDDTNYGDVGPITNHDCNVTLIADQVVRRNGTYVIRMVMLMYDYIKSGKHRHETYNRRDSVSYCICLSRN